MNRFKCPAWSSGLRQPGPLETLETEESEE